jgi:hypothetical protein
LKFCATHHDCDSYPWYCVDIPTAWVRPQFLPNLCTFDLADDTYLSRHGFVVLVTASPFHSNFYMSDNPCEYQYFLTNTSRNLRCNDSLDHDGEEAEGLQVGSRGYNTRPHWHGLQNVRLTS